MVIEQDKDHIATYYVSHALVGTEFNNPLIEKFAYASILASRKLRPYFKAHKIIVLTDQLLKNVFQKLDASRRLVKWAIELSSCRIKFEARHIVKAQALMTFS